MIHARNEPESQERSERTQNSPVLRSAVFLRLPLFCGIPPTRCTFLAVGCVCCLSVNVSAVFSRSWRFAFLTLPRLNTVVPVIQPYFVTNAGRHAREMSVKGLEFAGLSSSQTAVLDTNKDGTISSAEWKDFLNRTCKEMEAEEEGSGIKWCATLIMTVAFSSPNSVLDQGAGHTVQDAYRLRRRTSGGQHHLG